MAFVEMILENMQLFPKSPFFGAIMCQIIFFFLVILFRILKSEYADNEKKENSYVRKNSRYFFFSNND